jgi:pimeloyl-ACP methyl ester carboxylesterase
MSTGASTLVPEAAGRAVVTRIGAHEIHAMHFGAGDRVLVLLHGLSGSSRWWARNIPELAGNHRLLVPDLLGFGRSRLSGRLPTISQAATLLGEWLTTIEAEKVALAGHSMGGQISAHLAARSPQLIDKLILIDSAGIPRPLGPGSLLRFAAEVGPMWRWGDPTFLPTIAGDALVAGPRVLIRAIYHILRDDVRPLLPLIEVPTLVIWGERDTLVPLEDAWEFRQRIRDSRLAVLRGAAHNPMVDRPADFNRILLRFLDGEPVGR